MQGLAKILRNVSDDLIGLILGKAAFLSAWEVLD